jgi:hypothetical protein
LVLGGWGERGENKGFLFLLVPNVHQGGVYSRHVIFGIRRVGHYIDPNMAGIPPKQEAKDEVIEFDHTFGECAPLRKKNCKRKKKRRKGKTHPP